MNIKNLYQYYKTCQGVVSTDSRNCPLGSLFFALKGDKFDGNQYAAQALATGAAYAVVDKPEVVDKESGRYLLVHDTLYALQQLANYHRQMLHTPILAITGTDGKTTTKELIAQVLLQKYKVHYTQGNFNNHIGVPLTLLSMTSEHEIGIIEMGANHPGEIKELSRIVQPNLGLITNVGKAHLEGFGSFEGVVRTKSELYDYLRGQRKGLAFVHADDPILTKQVEGISKILSYGTNSTADIIGKVKENKLKLAIQWEDSAIPEQQHCIQTQLIGDYNLPNLLAAITVGSYFKVSVEAIQEALTNYKPENNRSQYQETDLNNLIIDTYNANPSSMLAALHNFCTMPEQNKAVILGDMRELGANSLEEHQKIIDFLNTQNSIHKVILVGSEFAQTKHNYESYSSVEDLKDKLDKQPIRDHTILIKGSNGIHLFDIIDRL